MGAFSEKQGAVRNKLMKFHSDMSAVRHKNMDSCGGMIVIKTRAWIVL